MVSISVIIPIYNVELFIQRCLESVMNQIFCNAEVECIIVDDCGQDHSMDIVYKMINDYHGPIFFKVVNHLTNRGLSAARNTGLLHASWDYILYMDSDDYLMPDCICCFVENLKKNPNVDMIVGNVRNCKSNSLLFNNLQKTILINDCSIFVPQMLRHQIYLYAWNKLIRRDLLMNNHLLFEEGIIYEDQYWSYKLFSHLSSILVIPNVTYVYENNPYSIINTTFTAEKGEITLKSYTISINKMLDNPLCYKRFSKNLTVDYILFMMNFLMNGVDVHSRCPVSSETSKAFIRAKRRILLRSMKYCRIVLSCFILLLFCPFSYLQKIRFFRHHYYDIESFVNRICHLTDFLHRKKM